MKRILGISVLAVILTIVIITAIVLMVVGLPMGGGHSPDPQNDPKGETRHPIAYAEFTYTLHFWQDLGAPSDANIDALAVKTYPYSSPVQTGSVWKLNLGGWFTSDITWKIVIKCTGANNVIGTNPNFVWEKQSSTTIGWNMGANQPEKSDVFYFWDAGTYSATATVYIYDTTNGNIDLGYWMQKDTRNCAVVITA